MKKYLLSALLFIPSFAWAVCNPFVPNTVLTASALNTAISSPCITSGTIQGATITNSPISGSTGTFTGLTVTGALASSSVAITGGTIDNTIIGSITPANGYFTTIITAGGLFQGAWAGAFTDGIVTDYTTGNGRISVGANDLLTIYNGGIANTPLAQFGTGVGGTSQYAVSTSYVGSIAATNAIVGFFSQPQSAAAAFTAGSVYGFYAAPIAKGAGSTITNAIGINVADQTVGTNNYGFFSNVSAGASKWGFYNAGNANNQMGTGTTYFGATGSMAFTNILASGVAPTISSGFGATPSVANSNGTAAFRVNVGTGGTASSGVIGLPTATNGWNCFASDVTTPATNLTRQSASTTTTVTLTNYNNAGAATAWPASDILAVSCFAY